MTQDNKNTTTVYIVDRQYQIATPEGEEQALLDAARFLDEKMRAIQETKKVLGLERIAVMAALNIASELLKGRKKTDLETQNFEVKIDNLLGKLEDALSSCEYPVVGNGWR